MPTGIDIFGTEYAARNSATTENTADELNHIFLLSFNRIEAINRNDSLVLVVVASNDGTPCVHIWAGDVAWLGF